MGLKSDNELGSLFAGFFGRGEGAVLSRAPGRANLIGEHTDYNDGFVLPIALDRSVVMVGRATDADESRIYSVDFDEEETFKAGTPPDRIQSGWLRYVAAVEQVFGEKGFRTGNFDAIISGDVPIGSGLSSSAALEVATAKLLQKLFDWDVENQWLALNCQTAEHRVGVKCGIMDQYTAVHAKDDHAIFLDCRTLEIRYVPFPKEKVKIVMCDTGLRHNLAETEYNQRRLSCYEAVAALKPHMEGITALRDVTMADLEKHRDEMSPVAFKCARHVITENERVLKSVERLTEGDIEEFGRLVDESHNSLRDDYQVSCPELDTLVEAARSFPGTFGARLVGAGFGGCTINLVQPDVVNEFCAAVSDEYHRNFGRSPRIHTCNPAGGAIAKKL